MMVMIPSLAAKERPAFLPESHWVLPYTFVLKRYGKNLQGYFEILVKRAVWRA